MKLLKLSDDLIWVPVKPAPGAKKTWILKRKDNKEVELEDFFTV